MNEIITNMIQGLSGASESHLMAYIALAGLLVAGLALWVALTVAKGNKQ